MNMVVMGGSFDAWQVRRGISSFHEKSTWWNRVSEHRTKRDDNMCGYNANSVSL